MPDKLSLGQRQQLKELLCKSLNRIIAEEAQETSGPPTPCCSPPKPARVPISIRELDKRNAWMKSQLPCPACVECRRKKFLAGWKLLNAANKATQECDGLLEQWLACEPASKPHQPVGECAKCAEPCQCQTCSNIITDWAVATTVDVTTSTTVTTTE
jgi:hypothetical protein